MSGSFKIAKLFGIDVFVHWSFFLLLLWIGWSTSRSGGDAAQVLVGLATVLALFGCVVLHELGHALTARRFGIGTTDITLLPIGGVARLERMPKNPVQEFWVAIAGPAVNVAIAAVLLVVMVLLGRSNFASADALTGNSILANLFTINLVLVIFNMLPAFPMDGGRVLRALLAMKMNYVSATETAALVGKLMAVLFAVIGIYANPLLLFIALFVFLGASGEVRMAKMGEWIGNLTVDKAMMTQFRTFSPDEPLASVVDELISGSQVDFPVCQEGHFVGMFRRSDLPGAIETHGHESTIANLIDRDCLTATPDGSLEHLVSKMQSTGVGSVPVLQGDRVVGLVSQENINELVMIRSAAANHRDQVRDRQSAGQPNSTPVRDASSTNTVV
ncbi:CBS domain-containing protein [Roseiconus nitratireducens]|uniref:Zinc metalloprotease n=1 Tax=Roseiconus nitratireducens TaxID=2605748 RepID=A0A5M6CZB3_9BACT|nr:site-2 protease family protein [Roseiconus nitratireducens]KAA5540463.1 CBS domain-containing protein [Roseiconus nitratireducens]